MAQDWQVGHSTGRCSVTNRELNEGEEFYAVLFEDGDSFRRVDYSLEGWSGPPEASYCHFKTRVPIREKKKRLLVDDEVLMNFFLRLESEEDPARVRFRFVLALILMRKRLLRYENSEMVDDQEIWTMTTPKDHMTHKLVNPRLTDDQIEDVSEQITGILHGDMGAWSEVEVDTAGNSSEGEERQGSPTQAGGTDHTNINDTGAYNETQHIAATAPIAQDPATTPTPRERPDENG